MEQKQLDETEDSYFGEEFIDEESLNDEIKIEKVASASSKKEEATATKSASTRKKATSKKKEAAEVEKIEIIEDNEPKIEIQPKVEKFKEEPKSEPASSSPVDPWADDHADEESLFKEVGTWKALSGLLVVLLLFAVFSNGFDFAATGAASTDSLTLADAEAKALDFVNINLLQPPFVAEVQSSVDAGNLYKITLTVAGESVDSYITKDGKLFFPQGFDIAEVEGAPANNVEPVVELETGTEENEPTPTPEPTEVPVEKLPTEQVDTQPDEPEEVPTEEPTPVEDTTPASSEATLSYKRWSFNPVDLMVSKGKVKLTLKQDTSNPDFTLAGFTFYIPELQVEKEISGTTTFEFTVDKAGEYSFICGSCTGTQKEVMSGKLIVK